ncbi:hypothetical protein BLA29_012056, partial [Euroglyphus maynei]
TISQKPKTRRVSPSPLVNNFLNQVANNQQVQNQMFKLATNPQVHSQLANAAFAAMEKPSLPPRPVNR